MMKEYKNLKCVSTRSSYWLQVTVFTRAKIYVSSSYPIQLSPLMPWKRGFTKLLCTFLAIQQLPIPNSRTTMNHLFAGQIRVGEMNRQSKDI